MIHSFDIDEAAKYGVVEATILYNLKFWIAHNKANKNHYYDGRYWTYNSVAAFEELFPYLTINQIRRSLEKLLESGVLLSGNYNNSAYDRTKWYALSNEMDLAKFANGNGDGAKTVNTDINTDTTISKTTASFDAHSFLSEKNATDQFIKDWFKVRKAKRAANTETAMKMFCKQVDLSGMNIDDVLSICIVRNWQSFEHEWIKPKQAQQQNLDAAKPKYKNGDKLPNGLTWFNGRAIS